MRMAVVTAAALTLGAAGAEPGPSEADFLARVRQLTFEGRRAGEGYFSPDGARLVFQSEREPGNPFFQIYEVDLATGDVRRVSPGTGKATCAFYRPGPVREIVFGSTHHDPRSAEIQRAEIERRAAGETRRYEWDFDPEMELYATGPEGALRRLTDARGYDAEASYSPDGRSIVFTSTRSAYAAPLEPAAERQLEVDPSWFAEIWIVGADGGEPMRLTHTPGYDGGPFFTADGARIVWRRFREQGDLADVWSMRPDGSDPRRLTEFGSMSWAPFPHPSGDYLIFTSNKLGFSNFELFLVDLAGRKEPVRVTTTEGFDGLPVFSPDGKTLAWTSTRHSEKGQIMIADWVHARAVEALEHAPERAAP